jgi:hypothetical protein
MEATANNGGRVILTFYSGPSAPPPNYIKLQATLEVGSRLQKHPFADQESADNWASAIGVNCWRVTRCSRAFPEARNIPIKFDDAPPIERLYELVAAIEAGQSLNELAKEVVRKVGEREFEVHPNLLRIWLIGHAPNHPALKQLKRPS